MPDFFKSIIKEIQIELTDEFDRNFERKAFFDRMWKGTNHPNSRGSLMMRTGGLRQSIRAKISGGQITWSSALPYASIHNEGGVIEVTAKMKKFFWAMYYKSSGAISKTTKGVSRNNDRNKRLSAEAQGWKYMALMKVGTKMKIEQRQFIGDHPIVRQRIESVINENMQQFERYMLYQLKK